MIPHTIEANTTISKSSKVSTNHPITLKQQMVINELPKCNNNISLALKRANYSPASCRSGTTYRQIRKITQEVFQLDPLKTKQKVVDAQKLFEKKGDHTNYMRALELEARLCCPEYSKQTINQENPDKVIVVFDKTVKPVEDKTIDTDTSAESIT